MSVLIKYNNKILKYNTKALSLSGPAPVILPAYTLRLRYADNYTPVFDTDYQKGTMTQVSSSPNIWDWNYVDSSWRAGVRYDGLVTNSKLLEVVAAGDTSGVTDMEELFYGNYYLTSVPLFDTSNVTTFYSMFRSCNSLSSVPLFNTFSSTTLSLMFDQCVSLSSVPVFNTPSVTRMYATFRGCTSLTTIPLIDTSNVTDFSDICKGCTSLSQIPDFDVSSAIDVSAAFQNCTSATTGILSMYQKLSALGSQISNHTACFRNCGSDTTTGSAELAQIPSDWK